MRSNLPTCVTDTATLLFQRCYEYRDEIRDELESSVAYVADAGRWVVGLGDWNSKMEKRLNQISELVLLANTLLTEYAVTGQVGAEGCRDELNAYLQTVSATVTLRYGKQNAILDNLSRAVQPSTAANVSSKISAIKTEVSGAISEILEIASGKDDQIPRAESSENSDAMNPFTESYGRPVDLHAQVARSTSASTDNRAQSVPKETPEGMGGVLDSSFIDGGTPKSPLSPVSMGEYECLDLNSIPKYAAFKSSAQLASRRQCNNFAVTDTSDGDRSAYSESKAEFHELFPMPLPAKATSGSLSSLDSAASCTTKSPMKPMMDMDYSYDFRCEAAHNPFMSSDTQNSFVSSCTENDDKSRTTSPQSIDSCNGRAQPFQPPLGGRVTWSTTNVHVGEEESKTSFTDSETDQETRHSDEYKLFG